jgi:hypothetical protein
MGVVDITAYGADPSASAATNTAAIQAAWAASDVVTINYSGTYNVNPLGAPSKPGTAFVAPTRNSILRLADGVAGFALETGDQKVNFEGFRIAGGSTISSGGLPSMRDQTTPPNDGTGPGARSALLVSPQFGTILDKLEIDGFTGYGALFTHPTGTSILINRAKFTNSYVSNCYWGAVLDAVPAAEYTTFENVEIHQCSQALSDWSGNLGANNLCITDNRIGVRLIGGYSNNGHGIISNSRINHSLVNSIQASGLTLGYNLTGNQIHLGPISILDCTGVNLCDGTIHVESITLGGGGARNYIKGNYMLCNPGFPNTVTHNVGSNDATAVEDNFTDSSAFPATYGAAF